MIFSLVLLVIKLVFIILLNIKHVIVRQRKAIDRTILIKSTRNTATRVQLARRIESVIVLISIITIRILVEVIKISNIHSTLLASIGSLPAAVKRAADSADRAGVSLVHLGVPPRDAVLDPFALRAWLSGLLSDGADRVGLVRLGLIADCLIVVDVLH